MVIKKEVVNEVWQLTGEALALCYRAAPGYEVRLTEQAAMILSGEPVADLNYIVINEGPKAATHLCEFVEICQTHTIPMIVLLAEPIAEQLAPTAQTLDLQAAGKIPLMTYAPKVTRAADRRFRYERVENPERLQAANQLTAAAFDIAFCSLNRAFGPGMLDAPGMDIFVARQNGTMLSSLQTTRAGATVGIWAMATAPQHQRQGSGRALLDYALAYHHDRGVNLFYLLATEVGQPLYEQTGFCTVAEAAVWVSGHSTQVSGA